MIQALGILFVYTLMWWLGHTSHTVNRKTVYRTMEIIDRKERSHEET